MADIIKKFGKLRSVLAAELMGNEMLRLQAGGIGPAIGIVGVLATFYLHLDALLCVNGNLLNNGVDLWFDMIGNRLRYITDSFIGNLLTNNGTIISDAENDLAPLMLVQHRHKGDNRLFQLGGGFFQFHGFGFLKYHHNFHGLTGLQNGIFIAEYAVNSHHQGHSL